MADFYIDAIDGASGNSGADANNPKQFISQATTTAGNRVFLKRGQIHPISTYKFFGSNTTVDAYGSGTLPILQKTAGGDAWIYIQDATGVTLQNFKIDGNGFNGALISINPTATGSSGHLLQNLELYGSANHHGLYIVGAATYPSTAITVRNCSFHDNGYHGALCAEAVSGVLFDSCISYRNGSAQPAHGFSTYSAGASPNVSGVVFKNCIAYGNIDLNGAEGQGFQFDNNSTKCSFIGCLSYNNQGAGFALNIGSGHSIIGCVAYGNFKSAIVTTSNTGAVIANNTFYGNCRSSATYTAEITITSTSTGATINNNILSVSDTKNPTGISVDAGSVSGTAAKTNCVYGFTTAASGITPTGTISTNPLLGNGCYLGAGSPCIGAGTVTVQLSDFNGKEFNNPPDIGAIGVRSARTIASRSVATRTAATRTAYKRGATIN